MSISERQEVRYNRILILAMNFEMKPWYDCGLYICSNSINFLLTLDTVLRKAHIKVQQLKKK